MNSVWLLKTSETGDSRYEDALSEAGFTPTHIPTLRFKFCNQAALRDALQQPQNHTGIIFTSPRAVEAVAQLYSKLNVNCHHEWNEKKIFVIGEATGKAVEISLKLRYIGEKSGNAQQLAAIIIKETVAFDKPLLYPCGNLGRDELPKLLVNQDRDFRALTCYETSESPKLKSTLKTLISSCKSPTYMVFFSPSGVEFASAAFRSLGGDLTGIKVIAIGPTTNIALVQQNIPVFGVCSSPTPDSLVHILKS